MTVTAIHSMEEFKTAEVSQKVGIRAMPTFVAFKDGQKVDQLVGAHPMDLQDFVRINAASPS
ncbi:hypothetical protein FRC00_003605 [Tulasnella sp. 408]|nr:hypothetical protein FRC00_003605 [Tulasnella sp. 408]